MELRHLRYFVAIAEELHFGRAAKRLGISQPPLSQQIRALELELGTPLFARNRRRVELLEAGQTFLVHARRTLEEAERAVWAARAARRGQAGFLTVGFVGTMAYQFIPDVLQRFRSERPHVELGLRELHSADQIRALHEGRIQIGIVRMSSRDPRLQSVRLFSEEWVLALPAKHPLARRKVAALAAFANEPFVVFPRAVEPELHDSLMEQCSNAGFTPHVPIEATQAFSILALVSAGLGVALVPRSLHGVPARGVVFHSVRPRSEPIEVFATWRAGDDGPLLRSFVEIARQTPPPSAQSA